MGSVGDAYDNAMAESFFTHLNVSYLIGVASRRTLKRAWRSSNSSRASTIHAVGIHHLGIYHLSPSSVTLRR